jgi:hypothetical protein
LCEMLAAAFDEERAFEELASIVAGLEELGLGGFGWGVAWLDGTAGSIHGTRGVGRFRDEGYNDEGLRAVRSRRFLAHLRRPSQLSTLQMADTQPFFDGDRSAWCHNGFLEHWNDFRERFAGRLHGRADSEVGWQFFLERIADGADVPTALRAVDAAFGGRVNLGYLTADGGLTVYSHNDSNGMWQFCLNGGKMAATELHSCDSSLFDLLVPAASERERIEPGGAVRLGEPLGGSPALSGSPGDHGAA